MEARVFPGRERRKKPPGGTPLYGLYRYVQPQRVWFFSRFANKLGIDFSNFAAILVINRVSMFALWSSIRVFFRTSYFFITPTFSRPRFAFLYLV